MKPSLPSSALALALAAWAAPARADDPAPPAPAPEPAPAPAPAPQKPAPPPYSVPWQLRPIVAPRVLRAESSLAFYEDAAGKGGFTDATLVTAAYRIDGTGPATAGLAPVVRWGFVTDDPAPGNKTRGGFVMVNPLVGAAYALKLGAGMRANAFFGATIPVGGGGGDSPDPGSLNSRQKGLNSRAQLDNAMFAVNDFTVIPGASVAYVDHGVTVQVEATLLHLMRVRGDAQQPEASKTNSTMGLHVGYFVVPQLSIGGELRYQRWFNAPFAVERDRTGRSRDTATFAIGPRAHFKLGSVGTIRPGVSYQRGLDRPFAASTPNYHVVQLDVPLFL
ncbi:MAG: hypothetical protein JNL38_07050 [Myxococcales bacterium]|nr:hypothetical protein [Myxococcales bacterium]